MHIPVCKSPFIQPLKFKVTEDTEMRKLFQALLLGCFDLWEEEEETGVWAGEVAVQYEGRKKKKTPTKHSCVQVHRLAKYESLLLNFKVTLHHMLLKQ